MNDNSGTESSSSELPTPDFPAASRGREGYRATEVDELVAELVRAMQHHPPTLAPYEVDDWRFPVSRFGSRYSMRAVDDYLERAHDLLRLRHGGDVVARLEGRTEPHHFPTIWIYLVALVLIAVVVGFALTQL